VDRVDRWGADAEEPLEIGSRGDCVRNRVGMSHGESLSQVAPAAVSDDRHPTICALMETQQPALDAFEGAIGAVDIDDEPT
jgi:hypothetical protein